MFSSAHKKGLKSYVRSGEVQSLSFAVQYICFEQTPLTGAKILSYAATATAA